MGFFFTTWPCPLPRGVEGVSWPRFVGWLLGIEYVSRPRFTFVCQRDHLPDACDRARLNLVGSIRRIPWGGEVVGEEHAFVCPPSDYPPARVRAVVGNHDRCPVTPRYAAENVISESSANGYERRADACPI